MLADLLNFVLSVFQGIVELFQYTDIGGVSYEIVLVSIFILALVVRVIIVKLR